jgi:hypothetical protein
MAGLYRKHLVQIEAWLAGRPNIDVLYVTYHEVIDHARDHAEQINRFLGGTLDEDKMVEVVDQMLYRQRA